MGVEISMVLCTYNRAASLAHVLTSLQEMTVPADLSWELMVVDNNSCDATKDVVERFRATSGIPIRYVFEPQPGLSHARNTGISQARGNIILFTDDDVTVDKHWVTRIRAAFREHDCMAVGGRIHAVWPGPKPSWFQERGPYASPPAITFFDLGDAVCVPEQPPVGANMAFRRQAFEKYGTFRVDLGRVTNMLMGGEDFEFFDRLRNGGERVLYIPDAIVHHPVTQERLEKRYFESWAFNAARSGIRYSGLEKAAVYYFGIPRYYFRMLLENLVMYWCTFNPDRRFFYKLQVYILAGRMLETRRLAKGSAAGR
jgi:glycosyltransferase involved in cell wall biosynthesis